MDKSGLTKWVLGPDVHNEDIRLILFIKDYFTTLYLDTNTDLNNKLIPEQYTHSYILVKAKV